MKRRDLLLATPAILAARPGRAESLKVSRVLPATDAIGVLGSELVRAPRGPSLLCTRTGVGITALGPTLSPLDIVSVHYCPPGATELEIGFAGWLSIPGEAVAPPGVYTLKGVTGISAAGTNYAFGDVLRMTATGGQRGAAVKVLGISGGGTTGPITKVAVVDPGLYMTPLADGTAQASTVTAAGAAGAGTGATFVFDWQPWAYSVHVEAFPYIAANGTVAGGMVVPANGTGGIEQGVAGQPMSGQVLYAGTTSVAGNSSLLPSVDILVPVGGTGVGRVPLATPAGGAIVLRLQAYGGGGNGSIPVGRNVAFPGELVAGAAGIDIGTSYITLALGSALGTPNMLQPLWIRGVPLTYVPGLVVMGTSIDYGTTGLSGTAGVHFDPVTGSKGWIELAAGITRPVMNMASPGNTLAGWLHGSFGMEGERQAIADSGAGNVFIGSPVNDFAAGTTAIALRPSEQQVVARVRGAGTVLTVGTNTGTPNDTSAAATAVNTVTTPQLQARAAWLRQGLLANGSYGPGKAADNPYDWCIDTLAVTESSPASGLWLNASTVAAPASNGDSGDGLHPLGAVPRMAAAGALVLAANLR